MRTVELDLSTLQLLPAEDLPGLDSCDWTCFWSSGGVCVVTDGCWFTKVS